MRILVGILFYYLAAAFGGMHTGKSSGGIRFIKHVITSEFISEGVAVADINNDGRPDIIAGGYWFEAPQWIRHTISTPQHFSPLDGYSNSFLNFSMDVNQDGWMDVIRISLPGEEAVWYENPRGGSGHWAMHPILTNAGNESPAFVDVDGAVSYTHLTLPTIYSV